MAEESGDRTLSITDADEALLLNNMEDETDVVFSEKKPRPVEDVATMGVDDEGVPAEDDIDEDNEGGERHDRISSQRNPDEELANNDDGKLASENAVGDVEKMTDEKPAAGSTPSSLSSSSASMSPIATDAGQQNDQIQDARQPTPAPVITIGDRSDMDVFFNDTRYFMIKSANYENVSLARARGVWATLPGNERRLNNAFRNSANVLLVFSVKESGRFQGIARISSPSNRSHPAVHWVLPFGLSADSLSGTFELDWLTRRELSFGETSRIYNKLNEGKPVKIGRDGQEIDAESGLALCRLFHFDETLDLEDAFRHNRDWRRRQQIRPDDGGEASARPPFLSAPYKSTRYQGRNPRDEGGDYYRHERGGGSRGGYRDGRGRHYDRNEDLRSTFDSNRRRDNRSRGDDGDSRRRHEGSTRHYYSSSRRHGRRSRSRSDSRSGSRSRSRSWSRDREDRRYSSRYADDLSDSGNNSAAISALLADAAVAAEAIRASSVQGSNPLAAVLANAALATPAGLPPLPLLQQLFPVAPPLLPTLPLVSSFLPSVSFTTSNQQASASSQQPADDDAVINDEITEEQHENEVDQFLKKMSSRRNVVGSGSTNR